MQANGILSALILVVINGSCITFLLSVAMGCVD